VGKGELRIEDVLVALVLRPHHQAVFYVV
jgi:hypothetical protein